MAEQSAGEGVERLGVANSRPADCDFKAALPRLGLSLRTSENGSWSWR